jgi:hypothetical protein
MQSNRRGGYGIAPYASRTAGGIVVPQGFPRPVRVRFFNRAMDYAVLELCDNWFDLAPIPISLEEVETGMNLRVYHCPVDTFNDEHVEDLSPFCEDLKKLRDQLPIMLRVMLVCMVVHPEVHLLVAVEAQSVCMLKVLAPQETLTRRRSLPCLLFRTQ